MSFQSKLKELCNANGMTPNAVAVRLGLSEQSASNWMHGATPRRKTLDKIADLFGVPVSYFFEEQPRKEEPLPTQGLGSLVMMPVIGSVRAGTGHMAQEEYTGEYIGIPVDAVHNAPQDYRILSVKGDSMYPIFIEGIDRVIVQVDGFDTINGSYVVAILKSGDGVIKKLHIFDDGAMELQSINPMYAPIKGDDVERIYGVVVRSERVF